jgi:hypothetical protein
MGYLVIFEMQDRKHVIPSTDVIKIRWDTWYEPSNLHLQLGVRVQATRRRLVKNIKTPLSALSQTYHRPSVGSPYAHGFSEMLSSFVTDLNFESALMAWLPSPHTAVHA